MILENNSEEILSAVLSKRTNEIEPTLMKNTQTKDIILVSNTSIQDNTTKKTLDKENNSEYLPENREFIINDIHIFLYLS